MDPRDFLCRNCLKLQNDADTAYAMIPKLLAHFRGTVHRSQCFCWIVLQIRIETVCAWVRVCWFGRHFSDWADFVPTLCPVERPQTGWPFPELLFLLQVPARQPGVLRRGHRL